MSIRNADVAELVDALVLGTSANGVGVRVPSSAPMTYLFELTDRLKIIQVSWMIFFWLYVNSWGGKLKKFSASAFLVNFNVYTKKHLKICISCSVNKPIIIIGKNC